MSELDYGVMAELLARSARLLDMLVVRLDYAQENKPKDLLALGLHGPARTWPAQALA